MALPNPLTFPVKISRIVSEGPDPVTGKYKFHYHLVKTSGGGVADIDIVAVMDNADDYPTGQALTFSLTLIP